MTVDEATNAGMIFDVSNFSRTIWPEMQVFLSKELYRFFTLAEEYAVSFESVTCELLSDIDCRVDIEVLEERVEHIFEVLIGEVPGWFISLRVVGPHQLLVANPGDDVNGLELIDR